LKFAGFYQEHGKELLTGGYAMIQSNSALSGQNGALPPEVPEQSLAPLIEKWRKEFETLLSSFLQEANTNRSQADTTKGAVSKIHSPVRASLPPSLSPAQETDRESGVKLAHYGLGVGQTAPGTNIPSWVGIGETGSDIDPKRIPTWDGQIPPGVPAGSVPFYSFTGSLNWLGRDGCTRDSLGHLNSTILVHSIADTNNLSPRQVVKMVRDLVEQAGRPLTCGEVWELQADYSGEPQNPYPRFTKTDFVQREAERLAQVNSPYGFSPGKMVPGTALPTWVGWQTPTQPIRPTDLPSWDGRIPASVPAGSIPFYAVNGHLQWLAPSGMIYNSGGDLSSTVGIHLMAKKNNLSVSDFVSLARTLVTTAGRPLTLGELYAGKIGAGERSLDTVA
jgi:hypothetical protein